MPGRKERKKEQQKSAERERKKKETRKVVADSRLYSAVNRNKGNVTNFHWCMHRGKIYRCYSPHTAV